MIRIQSGELDRTELCETVSLMGRMLEWEPLPGTGYPVRSMADVSAASTTELRAL